MSSLSRKRNLLDDKQKDELISYAKENPKLTQQQIADNLTIKWDQFIPMSLYKCKIYVRRVETIWESLSFHLITWLPVFNVPQFIATLVIPPNYRLHSSWRFDEGAMVDANKGHRKVRHNSEQIVNFEPEFNCQYHRLSSVHSWQIGIQYVFIYLLLNLTVPK
jgi:hypothetical protein